MLEKVSEIVPKWEVIKHAERTNFINEIVGIRNTSFKLEKGQSLLPLFVINSIDKDAKFYKHAARLMLMLRNARMQMQDKAKE